MSRPESAPHISENELEQSSLLAQSSVGKFIVQAKNFLSLKKAELEEQTHRTLEQLQQAERICTDYARRVANLEELRAQESIVDDSVRAIDFSVEGACDEVLQRRINTRGTPHLEHADFVSLIVMTSGKQFGPALKDAYKRRVQEAENNLAEFVNKNQTVLAENGML